MRTRSAQTAVAGLAVLAAVSGCGSDEGGSSAADTASDNGAVSDTGPDADGGSDDNGDAQTDGEAPADTPRVPDTPVTSPDPGDFVSGVDNPLLPLVPGTRWVYLSRSPDESTRIVTTVTGRTRTVQGVRCVVVHDVESTLDGEVLENTFDWYAQDDAGNVWYFGEDTTAYEDGKASKEGSWEAGVDEAQAGVIMLASPRAGDSYQQEYYAGEAEDQGRVLAVAARLDSVPARYGPLVETEDTTPLEPKLVEHKYYARGVGVVYEETVRGGEEQVRLVSMRTAR